MVSISKENEDFGIISEDYLSIYTINGAPLLLRKRKRSEAKYTALLLSDVTSFPFPYLLLTPKISNLPPFRISTPLKTTTSSSAYRTAQLWCLLSARSVLKRILACCMGWLGHKLVDINTLRIVLL